MVGEYRKPAGKASQKLERRRFIKMNQNLKKGLALIICLCILFGWYLTIFGVGSMHSIKDKLNLGLDIKGGVYVLFEAQTDATGDELKTIMEQTRAVMENRVNQMGLAEPVVTIEGEKRIRVELPGAENAQDAINTIGRVAQLQFTLADGSLVLDGGNVKDAGTSTDSEHGGYAVSLEFDMDGAKLFEEGTRQALAGVTPISEEINSHAIIIFLDGEIISAPVVSNVISGGKCVITRSNVGGYTQKEAAELAALIRGGALPVELAEINSGSQTATIGETAFTKSVMAGAIGMGLIFVIMIAAYSIMGLAACIALALYVIIVLWTMVGMGAVLTLPGIAGIILSIGMAVDANVVIFSRIREEIMAGKSVRVAVQSGFRRALATVMDSQITTIIAALVLYLVGTSTVKGFALTLMIGIIASIFTAVVVTNLYLSILADSKKFGQKKFYGINEDGTAKFAFKKEFDFIQHKKIMYTVACVIIIAGILVSAIFGMNYGIDFTGGTKMQLDLGQYVGEQELIKELESYGMENPEVIYSGQDKHEVIIRTIQFMDNDERGAVIDKLQAKYGFDDTGILASEMFSPSVGSELQKNAVIAVLVAAIGMLIYIIIRFEWKFGVAAIAGVFHDVLMVIAFYAIFRVTVNNPFIAGVLTVVGYSINDTIVIFDRIRENNNLMKKNDIVGVINKSINQTIGRSVMTSVTTLVVMIPMLVMAGSAIREFVVPLMVGVVVGCVSSITICSPIYYDIKKRLEGSRYQAAVKKAEKKKNA